MITWLQGTFPLDLFTTSGSLISSLNVINTVCWGTKEGFPALIYAVSYLPLFTLFAGVLIDYFAVFIIDKILLHKKCEDSFVFTFYFPFVKHFVGLIIIVYDLNLPALLICLVNSDSDGSLEFYLDSCKLKVMEHIKLIFSGKIYYTPN